MFRACCGVWGGKEDDNDYDEQERRQSLPEPAPPEEINPPPQTAVNVAATQSTTTPGSPRTGQEVKPGVPLIKTVSPAMADSLGPAVQPAVPKPASPLAASGAVQAGVALTKPASPKAGSPRAAGGVPAGGAAGAGASSGLAAQAQSIAGTAADKAKAATADAAKTTADAGKAITSKTSATAGTMAAAVTGKAPALSSSAHTKASPDTAAKPADAAGGASTPSAAAVTAAGAAAPTVAPAKSLDTGGNFAKKLEEGITVVKHNRRGASAPRAVHYDPDTKSISWTQPGQAVMHKRQASFMRREKPLPISTLSEVRRASAATTKFGDPADEDRSFQLVFPSRTVDITADSKEEADYLIKGFEDLKRMVSA